MNIVLMAGGGGTRLWPLSRKSNPKQFVDFGSGKTLLEQAYDRARHVVEPKHIFVATLAEYEDRTKKILPQIPDKNRLFEPAKRDTTAAFAAVVLRLIVGGQGNEPTVFMWSDHLFTNEGAFLEDLKKIEPLLTQNPESILMLGHAPLFPETGFGYIETGKKLEGFNDVFEVASFKEKPDLPTAEKFVAAGRYFWNMGSFSFKPSYFLQEVKRLNPDLESHVQLLEESLRQQDEAAFRDAYLNFPKKAVEYTVMERTSHVLAITGDYGWSDVGNWSAVHDIFGVTGDHMPHGHHIHIDSENNYIYNTTEKVVSMVGLKNTIAVVTDDAVLITNKKDAHLVKDVVSRLEAEGKASHL